MNSDHRFTVTGPENQSSLYLELPGGRLHLELAPGTLSDRAEEIADYLNLVVQDVTFTKVANIQPDLERLNDEQPVSAAVAHV